MEYELQYKPQAVKDLAGLDQSVRQRILRKLESLRADMSGDVKRLVNFEPSYRLRVGDWRVLFEPTGSVIIVWRIVHRSEAYG